MSYPNWEEMMRYEREGAPEETTVAELIRDLREMGVEGRHVMVHASYKALRPVEGGPMGAVTAFLKLQRTTPLFPTFDFETWPEQGYWDGDNFPSRMGVITECARMNGLFWRTSHPMVSFAVRYPLDQGIGYSENAPNAHGAGSVFDAFMRNNGLLLSIGADKQEGFRPNDVGFTASIHAAVEAQAPWRTMKAFSGVYVGGDPRNLWERCAKPFTYYASVNVDPHHYVTEVTPAHLQAEKEGIIKRVKLGRAECWLASAREFHTWAVESHRKNPELWRREI